MRRLSRLLILAALAALAPRSADAQKICKKGKPCGGTCIAVSKTCRVGSGSARSSTPPAPTGAPAATTAPAVPEDAAYVASSRGRVFYWIGCSAWKTLSKSSLRYFETKAEATAAGYQRSAQVACQGPDDPATSPAGASGATTGWLGAEGDPCTVSGVVDGDTLDCADGRRIRLLLVDAPEMGQGAFGALAKAALEKLAPAGETLRVENDVDVSDRYGRVLAYLYRGETSVNQELLNEGVAIVSVYPPNVNHVEAYRATEAAAREGKRGLWALDAFSCAPADFRARRCGGVP